MENNNIAGWEQRKHGGRGRANLQFQSEPREKALRQGDTRGRKGVSPGDIWGAQVRLPAWPTVELKSAARHSYVRALSSSSWSACSLEQAVGWMHAFNFQGLLSLLSTLSSVKVWNCFDVEKRACTHRQAWANHEWRLRGSQVEMEVATRWSEVTGKWAGQMPGCDQERVLLGKYWHTIKCTYLKCTVL